MVFAADNDPFLFLKPWAVNSPDKDMQIREVGEILGLALNIVLGSAIAISMIALIMSGIKYVVSKGDPKAKASAQQALTYSIVAFILAIGAFTIKTIVFNVIGGDFGSLKDATPSF